MNSMSAREVSGTTPVVEGGSVLLGLPGAPGSTTGAVFGCWASEHVEMPAQTKAAAIHAQQMIRAPP